MFTVLVYLSVPGICSILPTAKVSGQKFVSQMVLISIYLLVSIHRYRLHPQFS